MAKENIFTIKFEDGTCKGCRFTEHSEIYMNGFETLLCSGSQEIIGRCPHEGCNHHTFYKRRPTCPIQRLAIQTGQEIVETISEKPCPSKYHEGDKE